MRKHTSVGVDHHAGPQQTSGRRLLFPLLVLVAAPFLFDGARLCYARWWGLVGPLPSVGTPAFDHFEAYSEQVAGALRRLWKSAARRMSGQPRVAVGVLVFSLVVGALVMRHNRPR